MRPFGGRRLALWIIGALVAGFGTARAGTGEIRRRPRERLAAFARRVLPAGTELAHQPVEGAVGPGSANVVLLFRPIDDSSNYTGWVLTPLPDRKDAYEKRLLPPMEEIPQHFDILVRSVLFANADRKRGAELIVLYEYHRTGSEEEGDAAYVYGWNGKAFTILGGVTEKLVGLKSAPAVRRKLKLLGY